MAKKKPVEPPPLHIVRAGVRSWFEGDPAWKGWVIIRADPESGAEQVLDRGLTRPRPADLGRILGADRNDRIVLVETTKRRAWSVSAYNAASGERRLGTLERVGPCPRLKRFRIGSMEGGGLGLYRQHGKVPLAWSGTGAVWRLTQMVALHARSARGLLELLGYRVVAEFRAGATSAHAQILCTRDPGSDSESKVIYDHGIALSSMSADQWVAHLGKALKAAS